MVLISSLYIDPYQCFYNCLTSWIRDNSVGYLAYNIHVKWYFRILWLRIPCRYIIYFFLCILYFWHLFLKVSHTYSDYNQKTSESTPSASPNCNSMSIHLVDSKSTWSNRFNIFINLLNHIRFKFAFLWLKTKI